ncbi:hypothetical protein E1B28_012058 [Marasmius oreades]|uniref:Uncharacterized protein n=1 Tax=Marasmius oreades TaxID=181124 RepID=A0A9P7UPI8_9AGAR|nr:uncharacterized protein E1B28_012058 [Marasmius oreades]KAG7088021.1 hypothetical protein E1B28_012058 [Marasmius oreades]
MFNNSAHNNITSGTFNTIYGNQYNTWYPSQHESQRIGSPEEWKVKLSQEYDRIPAGRIKILRTIGESKAWRGERENGDLEEQEQFNGLRAKRVIHSACLIGDREDSPPFLSVAYTGRDAKKVFKRDLIAFSRIRHGNFVQLRGFNDSDIPMIMFQEEVVPVRHVLERHGHSPALKCYFSLQAGMALMAVQDWHQTPSYPCDGVWIQPRKGTVTLGPRGPWPTKLFYVSLDSQIGSLNIPALPINLYNIDILLRYLAEYSSSQSVLYSLAAPTRYHSSETVGDFPKHYHVWVHSSGQPVAKFQSHWTHRASLSVYDEKFRRRYYAQDQPMVMESGMTRFLLKRPRNLDCVNFRFELDMGTHIYQPASHLSWLSQACSIFSKLHSSPDEWSNYALHGDCFYLELVPEKYDHVVNALETPCYLFVLPPLQFFDGYPDIAAWMRGENLYYWSSDATGQSIMPESQRIHLGFPSLVPKHPGLYSNVWSSDVYHFIWKWQEIKGFDPTTTEFTRSLGFPVLELVIPVSNEALSGDKDFTFEAGTGTQNEEFVDMGTLTSTGTRLDGGYTKASENSATIEGMSVELDKCSVLFERLGLDSNANMEVD